MPNMHKSNQDDLMVISPSEQGIKCRCCILMGELAVCMVYEFIAAVNPKTQEEYK